MFDRKLKFSLIFLFFIFLFLIAAKADALTISPSLIKMELNPGESQTQIVNLFNETDQIVTYYAAVENFAPDKTTNVPIFLGNNDSLAAARWFDVSPKQIELKKGERAKAQINVRAPLLAEPGGRYASVLFSDAPSKEGGVKTANRLASLFLITVKGETKEDLKIVLFQKNKDGLSFNLQVENDGNVHLQPSGQVEIFDNNGNQAALIPINSLKQNILPQSRRDFNLFLKDELGWGRYNAKAKLYFGKDKMIGSEKIVFWVGPWNLAGKLLGIIAVALVIFAIFKIAKKRIAYGKTI